MVQWGSGASRVFSKNLVPQYGLPTTGGVSSILHVIDGGYPHAVVLPTTIHGAHELIDGATVHNLSYEEVLQACVDAIDRPLIATFTLRSAPDSGHQSDLLTLSAKGL